MATFAGAPCTALRELFESAASEPVSGRVVHRSRDAVGLQFGPQQRLVVLDAHRGADALPCSVLTPSLPPDAIQPGEPVELSGAGLRGGGWSVVVVRWWSPARVRPGTAPAAGAGGGSPVGGLDVLDPPVIASVTSVVRAMRTGDVDTAVARAADVLGRGPGSTPAGDDAIAGLLLAARGHSDVRGTPALDEVATRIARFAPNRTTALSAELLRHAAAGLATRTVVRAVLQPSAENRAEVLALGATSGAALLAGMDLASAAYERTGAAA